MSQTLLFNLPVLDAKPVHPPETRPSQVKDWLADVLRRNPVEAARVVGDALAATNRFAMGDGRRLQLAEMYWAAAAQLWPELEPHYRERVAHPLTGHALDAAKASLTLAQELSVAYKHLLAHEAAKRFSLGGQRLLVALVNRCLQSAARVLVNSYIAYAPVPAGTWHDTHLVYAFARERELQQLPASGNDAATTPERTYVQALLLALANPYGFRPGELVHVLRYLEENGHAAKLTDTPPVHRMAKAVAIVPVGNDFPPFSASKGGTDGDGRLYLLTFDLAFQLQERLGALTGAEPTGLSAGDAETRRRQIAMLDRLLRQWAIPPARRFNRLPSRARIQMCAGLTASWRSTPGHHTGVATLPDPATPVTTCQVINHTPMGYALRQADARSAALRIGELVALRIEGRGGMQIALVRWFRNTMKGSGLEFGCEILSDAPEAGTAVAEDVAARGAVPALIVPEDAIHGSGADPAPPQLIVPSGAFQLEQAISLKRAGSDAFVVLTRLVEQGPGFDIFEYVPVG